ncbi:MAG: D-alanyl-D-alanine carboxypeptidase [Nitrospirae bacterium]|nr:D-alanyl-D-alanine carboxypeptidase [Nitrospirota bacterium]
MKELRAKSYELRVRAVIRSLFLFVAFYSLLVTSVFADEISAKAAVVIDSASERILYAKNPNLKLPPASTTKLVTAITVLESINPDAVATVSENAAGTPSVTPRLRAGEKYTVRDLLHLALMRSVNSAAVALAEAVAGSEDAFVSMMNDKAMKMGAENARFINSSGLPGPGQYITAFDLAKIMKESLKYPLIREIINTRAREIFSEDGRRIFIKNTNQLLWTDDDNLGGKTGYTRAARHCFVSAAKKGQNTLIAAVLGESARDNLWEDSTALLSKGYDVLTQKAEPMIYFSSVSERPVVLASYNKHKAAGHKKINAHKHSNIKKVAAKNKKKNGSHANIAGKKKAKKSSGKNFSAHKQESTGKS